MIALLDLDFQVRRRGNQTFGLVVLALGVLAAAGNTLWYLNLSRTAMALEARIEALSTRSPAPRAPAGREQQAESRTATLRLKARRDVAERLAIPWQSLFDDLEAASDEEVAVLALQPMPSQHQVRLSGEAKDRRALERYLARLEATPSLEGVYLASHEYGKEPPPGADRPAGTPHKQGIRFALTARWIYEPF